MKDEFIQYECAEDFKDRLTDGCIISKEINYPQRIVTVTYSQVWIVNIYGEIESIYFSTLFKYYVWYSDGAPCGKLREVIK